MKEYAPKYLATVISLGLLALFIIFFLWKAGRDHGDGFPGTAIGIVITCITVFILGDIAIFSRAIRFDDKDMTVYSGLSFIVHGSGRKIPYDQIVGIEEALTPRKKFSNLKIRVKGNKIYTIFVTGIENYDEVKSELLARVAPDIKLVKRGHRS